MLVTLHQCCYEEWCRTGRHTTQVPDLKELLPPHLLCSLNGPGCPGVNSMVLWRNFHTLPHLLLLVQKTKCSSGWTPAQNLRGSTGAAGPLTTWPVCPVGGSFFVCGTSSEIVSVPGVPVFSSDRPCSCHLSLPLSSCLHFLFSVYSWVFPTFIFDMDPVTEPSH